MTDNPRVTQERTFRRMTLNQRIQHITLMTSFFTLVLTGFPLTYPASPASSEVVRLLGGFSMRSSLHRTAAVLLICLTIYHIFYMLLSRHGRSEGRAMIPNIKDMFDAIHMLKFYIGLTPNTPQFDRFNYIEKFEYLALGWGSLVMIATGFCLWFQDQAMVVLPKWMLDVAKVIHSYEALLAFLAIIVWHFYHVHLNPEVFPMSRVWLTGEISEHEMKNLHPLEYERILKKEGAASNITEPEREAVATVPSKARDGKE
ncbi:MAG: formate dehydrogenase subunit gamma [Armatimonadota bacterium]